MRICVIATITGSAICLDVFSNLPLASPSKWLSSISCCSAMCHLKYQKATVSCSLKANV